MVGGEIKVVMTLDNGSFLVQTMKAGQAIYSVRKTLDATAQSVKNLETKFTSFGQRFQDVTLRISLLRFALRDVYDIFLRIPKAILDTTGEFQRMTTLLEGMSKEVDSTKRGLEAMAGKKYIIEIAMNSPFKIEAIQDAFVKFKSVGLDPTNGSMKALIESVAKFGGSSDLLHRSSIAIQQMIGKGVVSMEELRQQLGEAIPDAMQMMAQGTGVTMGELVKQVSKGVVEAQTAVTNMLAIMAVQNQGAAEALSKTWPGLMARIATSATLAMNEIGNSGFAENMQAQMEKVLKIMNSMDFANMARDLGRFLSGIVDVGASVVGFFRAWGSEIKVVASVLATLYIGNKFGTLIVDMKRAFMTKQALLQTEVALVKATELEKATAIAATLNTKRTLERAAYTSTSRELLAAKAQQANHNNHIVHLEAQKMAMIRQLGQMDGTAHFQKMHSAELLSYRNLERQSARRVASLAAERAAHQANFLALNGQAAAQAAHIARIGQTSTALTSLKGVMVGMRTAFMAMGGWVTVLTAGVIYMTIKIIEWAGRAKRAAQEVQDAQAGRTGKKEYADNTGVVDAAKAKVDAQRKRLESEQAAQRAGTAQKDPEVIANMQASLARQTEAYIKAVDQDRRLRKNALMEGTRENLEVLQFTTSEKVKGIHTAGMAEVKALQDQQKKNPQVNLSAKINEKTAKIAAEQLTYLKKRQSEITAGFQGAKGEQKAVHAEYVRFIDEEVKMQEMMVANLSGVGTMSFINAKDGAGGNSKKTPDDHWGDALQKLKEQVVDLNGELNKKGSGDLMKMIEDLKSKGVDMTASKVAVLTAEFAKINDMKFDIGMRQDSLSVLDAAKSQLAGLTEKADGGSSAIGKLREKILDLLASTNDPEAVANLTKALNVTDNAGEVFESQRFEKSQKTAQGYIRDAKLIDASLIQDRRLRLETEFRMEIEAQQKMLQLKLEQREIDQAGYDIEMAAITQKHAAMYAKLQLEMRTPMQSLLVEWQDTSTAMEAATARWMDGAANSLVDFVMTGKASFKDLAASIIKDLTAIIIKKRMAGFADTLLEALPFANGGIMSSAGSVPLKKYAAGGIADRPQLAMFGEGDMNEAYVPLPDGRSIPVTMSGSGGDSVQITIIVNEDGSVNSQASGGGSKEGWKQMGDSVKSVVLQELVKQKRPGGLLYN